MCVTKDSKDVKIIDFGLTQRLEEGKNIKVLFGTAEFCAPEIINFEPVSFTTDMWSLGVVSYVLWVALSLATTNYPLCLNECLKTSVSVYVSCTVTKNIYCGIYSFVDNEFSGFFCIGWADTHHSLERQIMRPLSTLTDVTTTLMMRSGRTSQQKPETSSRTFSSQTRGEKSPMMHRSNL